MAAGRPWRRATQLCGGRWCCARVCCGGASAAGLLAACSPRHSRTCGAGCTADNGGSWRHAGCAAAAARAHLFPCSLSCVLRGCGLVTHHFLSLCSCVLSLFFVLLLFDVIFLFFLFPLTVPCPAVRSCDLSVSTFAYVFACIRVHYFWGEGGEREKEREKLRERNEKTNNRTK